MNVGRNICTYKLTNKLTNKFTNNVTKYYIIYSYVQKKVMHFFSAFSLLKYVIISIGIL